MVIGSGHVLSEKELASGRIVIDGKEVDYTVGLTSKQARDLLDQDLEPIRSAVDELVSVPINKNQRDALVSFAFNVGLGALKESSLLKALNEGNYAAVPAEFMKWTSREGGMELPGMLRRRKEEVELWNKPP
jgi:lysozyme